ncbi:MAG TPA: glycosyltransferase [Candidatus Ozemobacteraceae bacterium]|nr:glycosyltransferase [Candidatus Ozemobacteraceae bacterium]
MTIEALRGRRLLVLLPTYNESGNLFRLIGELLALDPAVDVLVMDDQSPDGTGRMAQDLAASNPRVHAVLRPPPRGRGLAGRDGFTWFQNHPEYAILVEMDADFSHQPKFIPAMVAALDHADAVTGSRFVAGGGETGRTLGRQITSLFANAYLRFVFRTRVRDCTSGFRAFTQRAFSGIDFTTYRSVGPTIVTELLFDLQRRGRRLAEVPILFEDRVWGESKLSPAILAKSLWFPLVLRFGRLFAPRVTLPRSRD